MAHLKVSISVWFFIGVLLAIYGVLILASGIYQAAHPSDTTVVLSELHIAIWWGALLLVIGGIYTYMFYPGRRV